MSDLSALAEIAVASQTGRQATSGNDSTAKAAREFEAYFVDQLLRLGSQPLFGDTPLSGGEGGKLYRDLFHQELARIVSERQELGIGAAIRAQLEASSPRSAEPNKERP